MGKKTAAAIVLSLVIIAALVVAIRYFAKDIYTPDDNVQNAENAKSAENVTPFSDTDAMAMPEEEMDAVFLPEEEEKARPDAWYGAFECGKSNDGRDRVDLSEYKKICPDIYAWIRIEGTDIDYPIAYCEDAVDPFYFSHDMEGNPSDKGMIITDSLNGKDFSDPLTLIYGHDPDDGTMFTQLHSFRDPEFFDKHDTVDIYMDDVRLIYRIYACYIGSSDHILVNYDFNDPLDFMRYFDSVEEARDLSMNIRSECKPSYSDHVISLITHCGDESKRLFVHAVLDKVIY